MKTRAFILTAFLAASCTQPKDLLPSEPLPSEAPLLSEAPAIETTGLASSTCGNGTRDIIDVKDKQKQKPEECDSSARGCDQSQCVLTQCGDGVLDPDESCDDKNTASKDGCSSRCEIELALPDNSFVFADSHPLTISRELIFVGSLRDEAAKIEPDYISFTVTAPMELVIFSYGFYDCGESLAKSTLFDKDKRELWSVNEFPETRRVSLSAGTYTLGLFWEYQSYTLWFRDIPTKS